MSKIITKSLNIVLCIIFLFCSFCFVGCDLGNSDTSQQTTETNKEQNQTKDTYVAVQSILLDTNSLTLSINKTHSLQATVLPTNATNKKISWKSSNIDIATVDQTGIITAKSMGAARITAVSQDDATIYDSCVVTITGDYTVTFNKTFPCSFTASGGTYPLDWYKNFTIKSITHSFSCHYDSIDINLSIQGCLNSASPSSSVFKFKIKVFDKQNIQRESSTISFTGLTCGVVVEKQTYVTIRYSTIPTAEDYRITIEVD